MHQLSVYDSSPLKKWVDMGHDQLDSSRKESMDRSMSLGIQANSILAMANLGGLERSLTLSTALCKRRKLSRLLRRSEGV